MSKKKYDVFLPPYEISLMNFNVETAQTIDYWHALIKTDEAYKTTKGEGVVVFVLDTTFKTSHPDLTPNLLLQYAKSFTNDNTDLDTNRHGIHCMGIIGAADNGIGVRGVAPNVKMIPVRVLNNGGSGSWDWVSNGVRYAADVDLGEFNSYKRIISMSLGGGMGTTGLRNAIQYAVDKGVMVLAAAGNSGYDGNRDTVNFPGGYEDLVITVASVGANDKPSSFSSGGAAVDVAAYGEMIYSTFGETGYARLSGTSMATPMVAGVAALIMSKHKDVKFTKPMLESFIEKFAKDVHTPGEDNYTGAGVPVITPYFENAPDGKPVPPPPPPPPVPPADPEKNERTFEIELNGKWMLKWGVQLNTASMTLGAIANDEVSPANAVFNKTLVVNNRKGSVTTKMFAANAYDKVAASINEFFRNRSLLLTANSDANDATLWTRHFINVLMKIDKVKAEVTEITGIDEKQRAFIVR